MARGVFSAKPSTRMIRRDGPGGLGGARLVTPRANESNGGSLVLVRRNLIVGQVECRSYSRRLGFRVGQKAAVPPAVWSMVAGGPRKDGSGGAPKCVGYGGVAGCLAAGKGTVGGWGIGGPVEDFEVGRTRSRPDGSTTATASGAVRSPGLLWGGLRGVEGWRRSPGIA